MANILQIKDKSGNWISIPAIKGSPGAVVSDIEPADKEIKVWIDTADETYPIPNFIYMDFSADDATQIQQAQKIYDFTMGDSEFFLAMKMGNQWIPAEYSLWSSEPDSGPTHIDIIIKGDVYTTDPLMGVGSTIEGQTLGYSFNLENGKVVSKEEGMLGSIVKGYYLDTQTDYETPYEPLYAGSPATKKYVDEHAGGGSGKLFQFGLDTNGAADSIQLYSAEYGMTFEEWLDSTYNTNTGAFTLDNQGYLYYGPFSRNCFLSLERKTCYGPASRRINKSFYIIPGELYLININVCCFIAGTQVSVSLDGATKNIEDMRTGDAIVIYNEDKQIFEMSSIMALKNNPNVTDQAGIILENGRKVVMNAYHPLLTIEGYKSITQHEGLPELTENDIMVTTEGNVKIKEIIRTQIEPTKMYNLAVNGKYHNFIVNSMVAHNATCGAV